MTSQAKLRFLLPVMVLFLLIGGVAGSFCARERMLAKRQREVLAALEEGAYREDVLVLADTTPARAAELSSRLGATLRLSQSGSFATLTLSADTDVEEVLSDRANRTLLGELSADPILEEAVSVARPDYTVSDSGYASQTYLSYIALGDVWQSTRGRFAGGERVKVAIIDSGIDIDHPDFFDSTGKSIVSQYSYNSYSEKGVSASGWSVIDDERGHGTAVAGVIAAQMNGKGVVGIAPEVELLIIKANIPGEGKFYNSDIVFGIEYATAQGANVINISIGGPNAYTGNALENAAKNNTIVVAAAGNESTATLSYPACDPNVIGVGALAGSSFSLATYSNFGENSDLVAPGTNIYTTARGGGYERVDGTSFSSPVVAGAIALYIAYNGVTSYEKIRAELLGSCSDLGTRGEDTYFGFGALNVAGFVKGEKLTVTLQYRNTGVAPTTLTVLKGSALQRLDEPADTASYSFSGWYLDPQLNTQLPPAEYLTHTFTENTTLYAGWGGGSEAGFDYRITSPTTVELLAYHGTGTAVSIPQQLDGRNVTAIAAGAFLDQSNLICVTVAEKIRSVGNDAFKGCSALRLLTLHSSTVAKLITGKSGAGGIANAAEHILLAPQAGTPAAYVRNQYRHVEQLALGGVSYTLYAKEAPVWQESSILTPCVPCESDGLALYTCTCCPLQKEQVLPKHDSGDFEVELAVTCTKDGIEKRCCTRCRTVLERRTVEALGHTPKDEGELHAATCTQPAFLRRACGRCNTDFDVVTAPALGHAQGEWITDRAPGKREEGTRHIACTRCNVTLQSETLAPRSHLLAFEEDVASLGATASKQDFSTLKRVLEAYAAFSEADRALVREDYDKLKQAVLAYNAAAEARNEGLQEATEAAADLLSELYEAAGAIWFTWKGNLAKEGSMNG